MTAHHNTANALMAYLLAILSLFLAIAALAVSPLIAIVAIVLAHLVRWWSSQEPGIVGRGEAMLALLIGYSCLLGGIFAALFNLALFLDNSTGISGAYYAFSLLTFIVLGWSYLLVTRPIVGKYGVVTFSVAIAVVTVTACEIHRSRESARRTMSMDNLRNLGQELHEQRQLNPNQNNAPPRERSWTSALLPYIDGSTHRESDPFQIRDDTPQNGEIEGSSTTPSFTSPQEPGP